MYVCMYVGGAICCVRAPLNLRKRIRIREKKGPDTDYETQFRDHLLAQAASRLKNLVLATVFLTRFIKNDGLANPKKSCNLRKTI